MVRVARNFSPAGFFSNPRAKFGVWSSRSQCVSGCRAGGVDPAGGWQKSGRLGGVLGNFFFGAENENGDFEAWEGFLGGRILVENVREARGERVGEVRRVHVFRTGH